MDNGLVLTTTQKQTLSLGQQQLQGLRLLQMTLPELRTEVQHEIESNPAIEDTDHPLETPMTEVEAKRNEDEGDGVSDFPEEDFTALERRDDEESIERRQAMFDRQTKEETLQEHLLSQLPLSDIPETDWGLVETLVCDLNSNGYYVGSIPDVCMAYERSEEDVVATLKAVMELDPVGCGARTPQECLTAQLDAIAPALRKDVRYLIDHLEDVADGRVDLTKYAEALKALRTLKPHPGSVFKSERDSVEYINPEVHAFKDKDGHWTALTDKRSLPEIHISKKFESILADKTQSEETKRYVRERIERAKAFREMIEKRNETVEAIAQLIFDRQQNFFEQGIKALKPLTETEIAEKVGVTAPTVSRTVRNKYALTPFGTIELRRFFTTAVKNAEGEDISQSAALEQLKKLIDAEDKSAPLSDEKLAEQMNAAGFRLSRRAVAKYRDVKLGIPGASKRRIR